MLRQAERREAQLWFEATPKGGDSGCEAPVRPGQAVDDAQGAAEPATAARRHRRATQSKRVSERVGLDPRRASSVKRAEEQAQRAVKPRAGGCEAGGGVRRSTECF